MRRKQSKTILLVEDEAPIAMSEKMELEIYQVYDVTRKEEVVKIIWMWMHYE